MQQDDWAAALPYVQDAEAAFRRLDERSNLGFVQTIVADTFLSAVLTTPGPHESTRFASRAEGRGDRLPVISAARPAWSCVPAAGIRTRAAASRGPGGPHHRQRLSADERARAGGCSRGDLGDYDAAAVLARKRPPSPNQSKIRPCDSALSSTRPLPAAPCAWQAPRGGPTPRPARPSSRPRTRREKKGTLAPLCSERRICSAAAPGARSTSPERRPISERGIALVERHRLQPAGPVIGTGILHAGRAIFRFSSRWPPQENDAGAVFAYAVSRVRRSVVARTSAVPVVTAVQLQQRCAERPRRPAGRGAR